MALLDKLFSRTTLSEESGEAEKKRKAAADNRAGGRGGVAG